jgi:hypothetical protein
MQLNAGRLQLHFGADGLQHGWLLLQHQALRNLSVTANDPVHTRCLP